MKNNADQSKVNTIAIIILSLLLLIVGLSGCKTKYVPLPIETTKTEKEYIDRWHRDSIHVMDSVFIYSKNDTVFLNKYRYLYRDKLMRDSIFIKDSIQVPYPVEIEKEVNRLTPFQGFQVWCGRVLILIVLGYIGIRYLKKMF
ncbi:hypothetical protein D0T84_01140 [Dysgonomonas sp. 521]|uniref:hypothetical protein n=1 Tax=Dysgonomonas sp. 521 TaxID=2302932 RepID=UPI0013D3D5C0|nr:hypothetical protein [Dysgonomonas sp. 521]NDV93521.1 hypothetical protein [Dysgonomonas sp. 521]